MTPVMVPPVPTPATKMSTLPSVSFQISGPVVSKWISRVGRVLELLRHEVLLRVAGHDLLGLGDGARHALGALGEDQLGAEGAQHAAPLERHGLGHGQDERVAARRGHEGQRDAGVAAGRLDDGHVARAGLEDARPARRPRSSPRRCGTSPSRPGCAPRSWPRRWRGAPAVIRFRRTSGVFADAAAVVLEDRHGVLSWAVGARQMLKSGTPEDSWTRRARSSSETPSSDAARARSASVHIW